MYLVKENDVYKRERVIEFTLEETITFKNPKINGIGITYKQEKYDWYMSVALEKSDKVKKDRHLLTADLLISYRWAIREGYNHQLDQALKRQYDAPRNKNTVQGIKSYISLIQKRSDAEMKSIFS